METKKDGMREKVTTVKISCIVSPIKPATNSDMIHTS